MRRHDFEPGHLRPTLGSVVFALIVLMVAAPALVQLVAVLVPLVLVVGVLAGALRLIWFYTGRW